VDGLICITHSVAFVRRHYAGTVVAVHAYQWRTQPLLQAASHSSQPSDAKPSSTLPALLRELLNLLGALVGKVVRVGLATSLRKGACLRSQYACALRA